MNQSIANVLNVRTVLKEMNNILIIFIIIIAAGGIITPYNTGNNEEQYCGFEQRDNCQSIPQNVPIHINDIQRLEL